MHKLRAQAAYSNYFILSYWFNARLFHLTGRVETVEEAINGFFFIRSTGTDEYSDSNPAVPSEEEWTNIEGRRMAR